MPPLYEDCRIDETPGGIKRAESKDGSIVVMPDGESRIFMRNFVRMPGGAHTRVMVAELNGVRVYAHGPDLIVTTRDLYA